MKNENEKALLTLAKQGDSDAVSQLIKRYYQKASAISRRFYISGADTNDLLQEALIALFAAINSYDENKSDNFEAFASMCMKNRLMSCVKSSNRKKNEPLNYFISLDDAEIEVDDPSQKVIDFETLEEYKKQIGVKLTQKEKTVLSYYLSGYSYAFIAQKLGLSKKTVDNMIYRVKKKLKNDAPKGDV